VAHRFVHKTLRKASLKIDHKLGSGVTVPKYNM